MSAIVTYTAILPVGRAAVAWFSRKLAAHRRTIGTRKGIRRITPWTQAVHELRFLIDGTKIKQLAADNALPKSTAYEHLWESLTVLAACTPTLQEVIDSARTAGDAHLGLDGTLIPTPRVRVEGPTEGRGLCYSGKHHHHCANLQSFPRPTGSRCGSARPGPAASTTRPLPAIPVSRTRLPCSTSVSPHPSIGWSWVDLGYEKHRDFPAVRAPLKKPKHRELSAAECAYNRLHGALRALAEEANADLKVRFKCLDKVIEALPSWFPIDG